MRLIHRALLICAAVTLTQAVAVAAPAKQPLTDHQRIVRLQHSVTRLKALLGAAAQVAKHNWPSLTDDEKAAIADVAKTLPKSAKFDIVCNDASCSELALDIDDALEDAGILGGLDHSAGPLGYGIGILINEADRPAAEKAVAALKAATAGRLDPPIIVGPSAPGYVSILIGKRPRQ